MAEKKTRSRTITVSDSEWDRIVALAEHQGRTVTRQVVHLAEERIREIDLTDDDIKCILEKLPKDRRFSRRARVSAQGV